VKLVTIIALLSFNSFSQELIPNSGFEEITGCPGSSVFLKNVKYWSKIDNHRGTPDQYYADCSYNGLNNPMAPGQRSFEGKGFAGSFCYGSGLREYMKVPLNSVMIKDSVYKIEFYVLPATGYGTFIDSYGVHFSIDPPKGKDQMSLEVVPFKEHVGNPQGQLITDTVNWTKISGIYKAQGGEKYATFGNFKSDLNTEQKFFKKNAIVGGRSYILIDGVILDFASKKNSVPHSEKANNEERTLVIENDFVTTKRTVSITIWDHMQEDKDSVNLYLNDDILLDHFPILKKKHKITLRLEPGEHLIKLHALNLGTIPPNTAAIKVSDGRQRETFVLSSDMDKTECLRILVE